MTNIQSALCGHRNCHQLHPQGPQLGEDGVGKHSPSKADPPPNHTHLYEDKFPGRLRPGS